MNGHDGRAGPQEVPVPSGGGEAPSDDDGARTDARVVARTQQGGSRWLPWLFAFQAAYWTVNAVRWLSDPDRRDGGFAVGVAVLMVAAAVGLAVEHRRRVTRVLLSEDLLDVERRRRPAVIPRADVRAVRGDVAGRPRWSSKVVVEHDGGTLELEGLDPGPGELVPLLQQWAEVGEQPAEPPG